MDYGQALEYIGSRLRFGIKPGLERTTELLEKMGGPQRKLRFVHIAGTNGKGSTCVMTASALIEAGYKTGLYTSPYITYFRERMQINGEMIPEGELAALISEAKDIIESSAEGSELGNVTEFELITCAAMKWFSDRECDHVVLETGLGGRLDSTNVIERPACTAITRVDLDHTAVLGDTIEKIAAEKAGIIKPGCPVVMAAEQPEEAERVISERAAALGAPLIRPDPSALAILSESIEGTEVSYKGIDVKIPLAGRHQTVNFMTAAEILRVLGIQDKYIVSGVEKARIPARLELICRRPVVLLDGAHNPNGAEALYNAVKTLLPGKKLTGVMGALADKDYLSEIKLLGGCFDRIYCCDGFSERCLSAPELARSMGMYTEAMACCSPREAFDKALSDAVKAPEDSAVIVFGSLYLAGELRPYMTETVSELDT